METNEIKINVQIGNGSKGFEVYTMDLTKKYIEINADYRSQDIEIQNKVIRSIT